MVSSKLTGHALSDALQKEQKRRLLEITKQQQDTVARALGQDVLTQIGKHGTDTSLLVGTDGDDMPFRLPFNDRTTHEVVIGRSGMGKSRYLEHHIRQDIRQGHGVCVIDPDGGDPKSVFRHTLQWIKANNIDKTRTVRVIDLQTPDLVTCLNPFFFADEDEHTDPYVLARITMEVFEAVWRQEFIERPLISKYLAAIFVFLIEHKLTLADIRFVFADAGDKTGLRRDLISRLENEEAKADLQALHDLAGSAAGDRQYHQELMGALNRVTEFTNVANIRRMFAGSATPLDLREVMDDGHILLVNLDSNDTTISDKDGRLIGTLLLREFFRLAKQRQRNARRFFCYVDECADYLSGDVATILDRSRKRGLSVVLALQRLGQLHDAGDNIYSAVMNNPNVMTVFGVKDLEDAKTIVDNMVHLDTEVPIKATIKPTHTGEFEVVKLATTSHTDGRSDTAMSSEGKSYTEGISKSSGTATGHVDSGSAGIGQALTLLTNTGADGTQLIVQTDTAMSSNAFSDSNSTIDMSSYSEAETTSVAKAFASGVSSSNSSGESETLKPIFAGMASGVHSLETVRYAAALEFRCLKRRQFFISVGGADATRLVVPSVEPPPRIDEFDAFQRQLFINDPATLAVDDADQTIQQRRDVLLEQIGTQKYQPKTDNAFDASTDDEFIEPKPEGNNVLPFPPDEDDT